MWCVRTAKSTLQQVLFFRFWYSQCGALGRQSPLFSKSYFLFLNWPILDNVFVPENHRESYVSQFTRQIIIIIILSHLRVIIYYYPYLFLWGAFHTSVSWRFLTGLTANLNSFRTLFNILVNLNNVVVWMVSTCSLFSKFSNIFNQFVGDCLKCSNHNWYGLSFWCSIVFKFSNTIYVLIFLFTFFYFYSVVLQFGRFSFLLTITRSGQLAEIRWSVCIPKSLKSMCVSFCRRNSRLCVYHLFLWSNLLFFCTTPTGLASPSSHV